MYTVELVLTDDLEDRAAEALAIIVSKILSVEERKELIKRLETEEE